ncbi:MAG: hypothetical protein ABID87_01480 [Chloroflexota bacterium]
MVKSIFSWGWYPAVITALAVLGLIYSWPLEIMIPALVLILATGLVISLIGARRRQMELSSLKIRQLSDYFYRRFMGSSSLSIFIIINTLFNIDEPKLWGWARACDMSQRLFNSWVSGFVKRAETDARGSKLASYFSDYLNELWSITSHYYEFVEQFSEIAREYELPRETIDHYNKFVMEYNAFVQDLRSNISELRDVVKTGIDPPSVKLAQELTRRAQ